MTTFFPKPLDKQVAAISDSLSQTQDGLAIVANGNTHAAISSGQFVYVKNHDTLAEGLYKATSAIEANGALSTSNLTPDGAGGLNDLQSQLTTLSSNLVNINTNITSLQANTEVFYITGSNQMYDMHNNIPIKSLHLCVIRADVMEARAGVNATGVGYVARIENDVTDFAIMASSNFYRLRVSNNTVASRQRVAMTAY